MTDKYLNETRQQVAEMRASLENTQIAIELSADKDDPAHAQAKERALKKMGTDLFTRSYPVNFFHAIVQMT